VYRGRRYAPGSLLEGGVGVPEAAEGVGVDGAEEWWKKVGEVGEAVGGEVGEIWEGGERVGERGGSGGGGDGEEGGEVGAIGLGDGVVQAGEVVRDAAVSLAHAQIRRHLRGGGGGGECWGLGLGGQRRWWKKSVGWVRSDGVVLVSVRACTLVGV
jgi:hypothetical protein